MKTTEYFRYTLSRLDRSRIKQDWILKALNNPLKQEKQMDGRFRKWAFIEEENRYLRVVVLEDGETVHNAFFDRGFKEDKL